MRLHHQGLQTKTFTLAKRLDFTCTHCYCIPPTHKPSKKKLKLKLKTKNPSAQ